MDTDIIKILLIEDNPGDARLLKEILNDVKSIRYDIEHKKELSAALQVLNESTYDAILLDLSLPDSDGFTTFSYVNEYASRTPIIVLTGYDDEELSVKAMQHGAQDYLVKGKFDTELLVRAIRYSIERQRLLVEMERAREHEQYLAYHDVLTNLPNRILFYDRLEQALVYAKRYSGLLGVLFLDLDGFKEINDKKGHSSGDQLLQLVANRLKKNVRESDTIARLGGDEFTVLLKGVNATEDVLKVAKKVLNEVSKPYIMANQATLVTCSVGISIFPYDGTDVESLIKKADFAMYRAKSRGKNTYDLFNTKADAKAFERISVENKLRNAIEHNELVVYFQPQVSLNSGEITGLEALVRWQEPELGLIPPAEFIPLAEETGLIVPLGEWVLRSVCHQNKIWQIAGYKPLPIAVNLSARQFRELGLAETIHKVLTETGLSSEYLMVEITETNAMQDIEYTISSLEVLKEMGIQIALDDFGTGYSSLSYLKRLPIDLLKIDKAFISDVPANPDDASIITAIVALAQNLGMKVIAEGVETKEQLEFLKSVNCNQMQGYYFSRPLPTKELLDLFCSEKKLKITVPVNRVKVI